MTAAIWKCYSDAMLNSNDSDLNLTYYCSAQYTVITETDALTRIIDFLQGTVSTGNTDQDHKAILSKTFLRLGKHILLSLLMKPELCAV